MSVLTPAGPLVVIPHQHSFEFITDMILLRPDCAFLAIAASFGTTRIEIINPTTGQLLHTILDGIAFIDFLGSMFIMDDHTIGYYSLGGPGFEVGRITDTGVVTSAIGILPFGVTAHAKEETYAPYDPVTKLVTGQIWTNYYGSPDLTPVPDFVVYGYSISMETLTLVDTWPFTVAQNRHDFAYYESMAVSWPGYGGAIGIQFYGGERGYTNARLLDNNGHVLDELPSFPLDAWDEVILMPVIDAPYVVAALTAGDSQEDGSEVNFTVDREKTIINIGVTFYQLYPKFQKLGRWQKIGQIHEFNIRGIITEAEVLCWGYYDIAHLVSLTHYFNQSVFQFTSSGDFFTPTGVALAVRHIGDPFLPYEPYYMQQPGVPLARLREQHMQSSARYNHVIYGGYQWPGSGDQPPLMYQLFEFSDRPVVRLNQRDDGLNSIAGHPRLNQGTSGQDAHAPRLRGTDNTYY